MASQVHEPESLKEDVQTDAVLTRILSIEKKWIKIPEVVKQILSVYMILSANSTAIGFFSPQIPCTRACSPPP